MENEKVETKKLNYDDTPVESTPKKKMPKGAKIALIAAGGLVGALVIAWSGINIFKYPYYHEFYKIKSDICEIPGYNSEPTAQGCTYDAEKDCIYTTAYTSHKAATIYTVANGKTLTHKLYKDGKEFTGHVGGIATSGDLAYIADGDKVYTVPTAALHDESKTEVDVGDGKSVNNQASFIFCDDKYVWVGEFHDGKNYITNNVYGENHAIIEKYHMDAFALTSPGELKPVQVISIMNKVQGFCVTPLGNYVFSTSYGLADSYFFTFNKDQLVKTDATMFATDVYAFEGDAKAIKAPPMMEDLDIYKDGTVVTLSESGSNKYIFGKLFFANHIISLDIK